MRSRFRFPLVSARELIEAESPDLSYIHDIAHGATLPSKAAKAVKTASKPPAPLAPQAAEPEATAAARPTSFVDPTTGVPGSYTTPTRERYKHHETGQPTLAMQHRPDLPHGHERMKAHEERFYEPGSSIEKMRHIGNSANPVFHTTLSNGHQTIVKPLTGMKSFHEPEHIGPRNDFLYDFMSGVGAHHMAAPGMVATVHGDEQMSPKVARPQSGATPEETASIGGNYAGHQAHVSEFVPGMQQLHHAPPEDIEKVDEHHRLLGALAHLTMGNTDGRAPNIGIVKGAKGPHPVLYDSDITAAHQSNVERELHHGKPAVRSEFLYDPDEPNSQYRGKLAPRQEWGNNYPPEVTAHLQELAAGGHHRLGMSHGDIEAIRRNAHSLLTKGLEQTIRERQLLHPSNQRDDGKDATAPTSQWAGGDKELERAATALPPGSPAGAKVKMAP